jgi:hypothetical protein
MPARHARSKMKKVFMSLVRCRLITAEYSTFRGSFYTQELSPSASVTINYDDNSYKHNVAKVLKFAALKVRILANELV